ncbi:MAG: hypothetical protein WKF34_01875 [Pyrinomonadaceae bacterium]
MKKNIFAILLITLSGLVAFGQDDYKKAEFFVGYSNGQVDNSNFRYNDSGSFRDIGPPSFHGFNVAGVYNFSRYIGLKGDVSGTYNSNEFSFPIIQAGGTATVAGKNRNSLYNVVGGVQIKDNSDDRRFKPFAHGMVGAGFARRDTDASCAPTALCSGIFLPTRNRDTGFAGVVGGGIDVKVSDRIDLRAFQIDYNPIRFSDVLDHNVRISVGIVFK